MQIALEDAGEVGSPIDHLITNLGVRKNKPCYYVDEIYASQMEGFIKSENVAHRRHQTCANSLREMLSQYKDLKQMGTLVGSTKADLDRVIVFANQSGIEIKQPGNIEGFYHIGDFIGAMQQRRANL